MSSQKERKTKKSEKGKEWRITRACATGTKRSAKKGEKQDRITRACATEEKRGSPKRARNNTGAR